MVLVVGSELIDDLRRAPDDVLSFVKPLTEVRRHDRQVIQPYSKDFLAPSTRIHARLIGQERPIPHGHNPY